MVRVVNHVVCLLEFFAVSRGGIEWTGISRDDLGPGDSL